MAQNQTVQMIDWEKALDEIDFIEYFCYKMPNFQYDNRRKAFIDNLDSSLRSDKFEFFKGKKDGRINYISRATGNAGNLIHFIKNHIVQNEPNVWRAINKELLDYTNNLSLVKSQLKERAYLQNIKSDLNTKVLDNSLSENFQIRGKFYPLHKHQQDYITEFRQISIETLESPLFKNILQSYKDENDPFFTAAFSIKDINGNVTGIQKINTNPDYSNFNEKRFTKGSNNDNGFVFSNPIEIDKINLQVNTKQGGRNLIVTEALMDAMAHYELHKPQNTEYLATSGEISQNKAFLLKQWFDKRAFEKITLATDNDKRGCYFDTIIISALIPEMKINYKDKDFFSISLQLNDKEAFQRADKLVSKFREIDKKTAEFISDVMPRAQAVEFIMEEKAISYLKRNTKTEIEFLIPNDKLYLETFNHLSLQIFPNEAKKINITKPIQKDWNDDLKVFKNSNANEISNKIDFKEKTQIKTQKSKGLKL